MRPTAIIAAALATATAFAAEPQQPDTIKTIDNASSITVTRIGNTTRIEALIPDKEGTSLDRYEYAVSVQEKDSAETETISESIFSGFPFLNDRAKKKNADSKRSYRGKCEVTALRNIYWGWNFAYDGKAGLKNSFEVGVAEVIGAQWKPWRHGPELRVGLGFGMKRYTAGENLMFSRDGDRLVLAAAGEGMSGLKSKWDTWTFHVPLMASQSICGDFGIAIGAMINFNTYSTAKSSCEVEGVRYTEKFKRLQQRLLTAELVAIIGIREGIGFYAKWNPVPLMKECYGPEFRSWSMGVSLNF